MDNVREAGKTVLLCMSFIGYFFALYRFGRVKSFFAPVACMAGIGLAVYWGGMSGRLALAADIVFAGGLAAFAVFFVFAARGRIELPRLTFFGVCFWTGTAVFAVLSLNLKLLHYDNFSHWALLVKYLLSAGKFPEQDTVLIPFRDYPPGTGVFIYYVCRFAGTSQGIMLLAQNSLIFACFYAIFGIVKESRRFLLYSFLGAGCAILSYLNLTVRINNLLVDFLLPLLALASAAVSYRYAGEKIRLCFLQAAILGFTGIVKSTGLFFAAAAWGYAAGTMIFCAEKRKAKAVLAGLFLAAAAVIPLYAWQYRLDTRLSGFQGKFEQGSAVQIYGEPVREEDYQKVAEDYLKKVFDPSDRAFQMIFLCTFFSAAAILYARFKLKKRWRLRWLLPFSLAAAAVYYGGMLAMYLYSMPAEEALRLAGFERYACSAAVLFSGALIMGATVDMEHSFAVDIDERGAYRAYSSPGAKKRYQYAVLGTLLVGINFLYSERNGLRSIQENYETSLPGQAEQLTGDCWYEDGYIDPGKYLVVAPGRSEQIESGEIRYVFRYFLWALDVDVTESLDEKQMEKAEKEYKRIFRIRQDK